MRRGNQSDWHEICVEVLLERNTDRFNALLEELLEALEKREDALRTQFHI